VIAAGIVRDVGRYLHAFGGTLADVLSMPFGWFRALVEESDRIVARENLDATTNVHTSNPQWLMDRYDAMSRAGTPSQFVITDQTDDQTASQWDALGRAMGG